jgi:sialic acid synthase SpsE
MITFDGELPSRIKIGDKYVGEGEPTFVIAEIGNNHNGDYYLAKKTIEQAYLSGADAVKFQKRTLEDVFTRELLDKPQIKDQVFGKTYGEYRKNFELKDTEFVELKKYAESLGLIFFATPFDKKSADFFESIGMELYKIASFDVTHLPLLEYIAKKGRPIFLSVGMSDWDEIDEAVETILLYNNQLIIKHCVAIYPAPDDKLNLSTIKFFKERYSPLPIGYSGHEADILPSIMAVIMGADSIERHFTLDKNLPGPDHATVSLNPDEFKSMVAGIRRAEQAVGKPLKGLWDEEKKVRDKHSTSIVSAEGIPAGTVITYEKLTFKSPGYGFKPSEINNLIGRKAKVDIEPDTVIIIDHLE